MNQRKHPTVQEVFDGLAAGDPELQEAYEELEPAYLVAREVLRSRAELGISQAELARRMNTSQSVISRLENMDGSPNLRTVLALAEAMGRKVELRFVEDEAGGNVVPPEVLAEAQQRATDMSVVEVLGLFCMGLVQGKAVTGITTTILQPEIITTPAPPLKTIEHDQKVGDLMRALRESVAAAERLDPGFAVTTTAPAEHEVAEVG